MHAGLLRIGRWLVGAGLATAVVLAHAQRLHAPSDDFPHAMMSGSAYGGAGSFDGLRANVGGGLRNYSMRAERPGREALPFGRYYGASPYEIRRFTAGYSGGITPISAEARAVPRRPADSSIRAGSIREDVARYNEERAAFRPFARGSADGPRPPMPSPYRN
jgi:hypothetical protein